MTPLMRLLTEQEFETMNDEAIAKGWQRYDRRMFTAAVDDEELSAAEMREIANNWTVANRCTARAMRGSFEFTLIVGKMLKN